MRNETEGLQVQYGVNRIVQLSPEQIELSRRSGSRIFIATMGEGMVDTILLQGQRPMENYMDAAARAISLARLQPFRAESISLKPGFNPTVAAGMFQQFLSSNCWLQDENGEAYDLIIELEPHGLENLQSIPFETLNSEPVEGYEDNPIIFKIGVEELGPELDTNEAARQIDDMQPQLQTNTQPQSNAGQNDDDRSSGGQGRVKHPESDGRLKQNRAPQLESARAAQSRDDAGGGDNMSRQAGKPGRVRVPGLDFRRKEVRQLAQASR
jgi:hypothetical protein